ncbi:MarR family winged helix-turn-helix transcriptional regulator [Amycolatopsis plumensis]|uniref:MarR family winged helix-turn-helix transcriptional regulator n=1 Tax=Amycolatopsis plumensis TaxID=236508 RepID=A0ABV5UE85_9PSEU
MPSEEIDRDVCKLVHGLARTLDGHVRRVADAMGLTPSQVVALRELSEPITARELAARMACEASNATFVLDRLEERGLLNRHPHPGDRRAKQIVLTPEGDRRRAEAVKRLGESSPLGSLRADQQEALRNLLQALASSGER